ncbi:MAG: hypothetical protein ACE366_19770 [Bradymonadia bacterium]
MSAPSNSTADLATFTVDNPSGLKAPLSVGLALPQGRLADPQRAALVDPRNAPAMVQCQATALWPDGSVKWLVADLIDDGAGGTYRLVPGHPLRPSPPLGVDVGGFTGPRALPLARGLPLGATLSVVGARGRRQIPAPQRTTVEMAGPLRGVVATTYALGELVLTARISVWSGLQAFKVEIAVHNPQGAVHKGNLWDLGDPNAVYFRDISLRLPASTGEVKWREDVDAQWLDVEGDRLHVFQASSGGSRWNSRNHVNAEGMVPLKFRGWRAQVGDTALSGDRASPELSWTAHTGTVKGLDQQSNTLHGTIEHFWQSFPKAMESDGEAVRFSLWPVEHGDRHEIQPGERKTHVIWLGSTALGWVHQRPRALQTAAEVIESHAADHLGPVSVDEPRAAALIEHIVDAEQGLAARREIIDEYGWRNFGDLYADHETVHHQGPEPMVSHYNNQYDCVEAFFLQGLRSADRRWFDLAEPLAWHYMDIDTYKTTRDRDAYNRGLFWHSDHYMGAGTATHRAYSKLNAEQIEGGYGGGPSNEHNYPSGAYLYYCLTGHPEAARAVIDAAEWVMAMENGADTLYGPFALSETGLSTMTVFPDFHGPGRGAGNSLNALCTAYRLSGDQRYLNRAERIIRRVTHPAQDIETLDLLDVEYRWSYTVFLKYLAHYVHLKEEHDALDEMWAYARASLLRFAQWMVDHERSSTLYPERLEHYTETWPAQDLRKAQVVWQAAWFAPESVRQQWFDWAEKFYDNALTELLSFRKHTLCRPLILQLHPAVVRAHAHMHPTAASPHADTEPHFDFGEPPGPFVPQKSQVKGMLKSPTGWVKIGKAMTLPSTWRRLKDRLG